LKIALPAGAQLWSASLSGKPVRPGKSGDGSLLLPLEKSRAGEEAAPFAVEIVYLSREAAWDQKGKATLPLPALDLPISRTGVLLYHPPLFKVTASPGTFVTKPYEDPLSTALNPAAAMVLAKQTEGDAKGADASAKELGLAAGSEDGNTEEGSRPGTRALVDKYLEKSRGRTAAGILPIAVAFPSVGPSLFLVSELTSENQAANVELSYERDKKGANQ